MRVFAGERVSASPPLPLQPWLQKVGVSIPLLWSKWWNYNWLCDGWELGDFDMCTKLSWNELGWAKKRGMRKTLHSTHCTFLHVLLVTGHFSMRVSLDFGGGLAILLVIWRTRLVATAGAAAPPYNGAAWKLLLGILVTDVLVGKRSCGGCGSNVAALRKTRRWRRDVIREYRFRWVILFRLRQHS